MEMYGLAVADASKAIELDPSNVKAGDIFLHFVYNLHPILDLTSVQAYYRRASANTAILHHREALRDWRVVIKKSPNDQVAKIRVAECDKIVKRDAFLKAIEVEDAPSAFEGLDLDSMVIEANYDGVRLEKEMTQEFIEDMIQRFKDGKKIARKYVFQIILAVRDIVYAEPTMVEVDIEPDHMLTVCGDTHGMWEASYYPSIVLQTFLFKN
jgi:serine/threonine-protein phosphatase 5